MIEIDSDWKKHAAQVYSDKDVEKAFLDQAYMFVQNKATPLMKDPYRLGFEIVYKNDANSKMVGIFAFKVGGELIYAPAFFVNGAIKGTDLLYRHKSKTFVPLTNEWASYLVGLQENKSGESIAQGTDNNTNSLDIQKLITPQGSMAHKMASYSEFKNLNDWLPEMSEVYDEIQKSAFNNESLEEAVESALDIENTEAQAEELKREKAKALKNVDDPVDITEKGLAVPSKEASLLREMILDVGKHAVQQVTDLMQKDATFAQNILDYVGLDNVLVEDLDQPLRKEASASTGLTLHMGFLNDNVKKASEKLAASGFLFEDNRDESSLVYRVFEEGDTEYSGVSEAGIYKLLMQDGSSKRCLVAPANGKSISSTHWSDDDDGMDLPLCCGGDRGFGSPETRYTVVELEGNAKSTVANSKIITAEHESERDVSDNDLDNFPATPTPGNYYVLLDLAKGMNGSTVSDVFYVKSSVSSPSGVDKYKVDWSDSSWGDDEDLPTITLNPDYDSNNYKDKVFKKGEVAFVKVDNKQSVDLASSSDLHNLIMGGGMKSASVHYTSGGGYISKSGSDSTSEQSELSALCYLMKFGSFSEELAVDVLDKAKKKGRLNFFMPKEAHNLSFGEDPESYFTEDVDDIFNISQQSPQSVSIIADSSEPDSPGSRIGDSIKFDDASQLEGKGPNDLAALADELGTPSIFEHGVVGSLANTYDSNMLIDKYFPDLEKALDRLGRMVFLFYWKPEDFSHLYGSDDQSSLENMLVSNFKSFGELVLELLKKISSFSESTGRTY